MKQVIIVGGGMSGLAIGFALKERGMTSSDVAILEKNAIPGGNVQTEVTDGYTVEQGPNGFLDNSPATLELVEKLEIDYVLPSNTTAARRFIWRNGKLREIKPSPAAFLASGVLPLRGALRVALEPFQKKGSDDTESVFDFAARRIGKSAAENLVGAMVQGVFAGDAKSLELKSAFPKMYAMEKQYGSLVKAMIAKKRRRGPKGGPAGPAGRLTSFDNGMHTLPAALAANLGEMLLLNHSVTAVEKKADRFVVTLTGGQVMEAKSVVMANPAWCAASQLKNASPVLAGELESIHFPPVMVVATGFNTADLPKAPDGFGFLVPRNQGVRSLGCLWSSSVWKYRVPEGKTLLRTMVGGAVDAQADQLSDDQLTSTVLQDLTTTMGIRAIPEMVKVYRYPKAIAQYEVGHSARINRIEKAFLQLPGLFLSGSSYGGISVNHCVEEAPKVAGAVMGILEK